MLHHDDGGAGCWFVFHRQDALAECRHALVGAAQPLAGAAGDALDVAMAEGLDQHHDWCG